MVSSMNAVTWFTNSSKDERFSTGTLRAHKLKFSANLGNCC